MSIHFLIGAILISFSIMIHASVRGPYLVDSKGLVKGSYSRSLCGANDMIPMISSDSELQQMGTPIGIYEADIDGSRGYCTGTLITKDLFLTAQHCAAACNGIKVTFGYLSKKREESFKCKEVVEKGDTSYENDYLIVRLEGNPGVQWGWYDVTAKPVAEGSELLMIHHPKATPMKVSQKNCVLVKEEDYFLKHRCDTQPGSSGSAIFLPNYDKPEETRIVGVHTLGGCDEDEASSNSGPSMRHLVDISPTLKAIAK